MSSVLNWENVNDIVLMVVLCTAAMWDLRTRRIPNQLTLGALGIFVVLRVMAGDVQSLRAGLEGGALGLVVGLVAAGTNLAGGGDAKLLAAVGACLGPGLFGGFCIYTALATGFVALVYLLRDGFLRVVAYRVSHALLLGDLSEYRLGGESAPTTMPMALPMLVGGVAVIWRRAVG